MRRHGLCVLGAFRVAVTERVMLTKDGPAQTCATSALVGMAGAGRPISELGRVVASRDGVASDAPLRLKAAAALAFPGGTMTATGLRQEAKRGQLALMRIAGKDFTTLDAIEEMKQRCQLPSKAASGSEGRKGTDGSYRQATWIILDGEQHGSTGCAPNETERATNSGD